ncbi:Uncharacterised protein [Chromobacterium violaceum]|uniref:Uncharacterized protein n=1 Tax=Chromobacterium violaceum TaxID=536 RepID=A0A3S4I8K3_CHRVL|nr:Uncharacterised protein [Chromobacterium violaceum]
MRLLAWNALRYLKPEGNAWQQGFRFYTYAEDAASPVHPSCCIRTRARRSAASTC